MCKANMRGRITGLGIVPTHKQKSQPGADHRNREEKRISNAQSGSGKQIVEHGIAEESIHQRQHQQSQSDEPVQLSRFAVGGGQEDACHMRQDGPYKDQCSPVVHLPHQQTRWNIEAEVQHGAVGDGDFLAVQRMV